MFFDSHTHLNNEGYTQEQRQQVIDAIETSRVCGIVDIGFDLESSALAASHAEQYEWCYAAVGCHPHEAEGMDEDQLMMFRSLAQKEKVRAIGEIGLDYFRNHSPREDQQYWFRRQIRLANQLKMPIVIHDRDASADVLAILKEEGAFSPERKSWFPPRPAPEGGGGSREDARVLMHCYSGSRELAQQYIKLGATLSVAGPVTYKNNRKGVEVVSAIPLEFLLIETDAPYLTPEPFRGRPNQSPYIEYTAVKVAELKGVSLEEAARVTCENARRFFGIR